MCSYDIDHQRSEAIRLLLNKQDNIYQEVTSTSNSYHIVPHPEIGINSIFEGACYQIKQLLEQGDIPCVPYHSSFISIAAYRYVKLGNFVERLKNGEDPRIILYEIVSDL